MWRLLLLVVALAGCRQLLGLDPPMLGSGATRDASGDAANAGDADAIPDASACMAASTQCLGDVLRTCSSQGVEPVDQPCAWGCGGAAAHCEEVVPSGGAVVAGDVVASPGLVDVTLAGSLVINADTGAIGAALTPTSVRSSGTGIIAGIDFEARGNVGVFRFKSVTVSGTLAVIGVNAIAFVADGDVDVPGTITLGDCINSLAGGFAGGGSLQTGRGAGGGPGAGMGAGNSSDGGAGGSYGGIGGHGGNASATSLPYGDATITTLVGGSGGGGGGQGQGGAGGGALQLVSNAQISIAGGINAGGCGGRTASTDNGGGGGGAGGAILVEAPSITIAGALAVNGGGGGGAKGSDTGGSGTLDRNPALGGQGNVNGGAGAAGANENGTPGPSLAGRSGGGGGGIGRIRIATKSGTATLGSAVLSPAPSDPATTCTVGAATVQ